MLPEQFRSDKRSSPILTSSRIEQSWPRHLLRPTWTRCEIARNRGNSLISGLSWSTKKKMQFYTWISGTREIFYWPELAVEVFETYCRDRESNGVYRITEDRQT